MDLQSGYPFSLIRYGIPHEYPRLDHDLKTDVVVVGGGISGALVAHYLNKAGIDCTVIDRRTVGLGSTCASTSLLQYEIDVPLTELVKKRGEWAAVRAYELCREAIYTIAQIAAKTGVEQFEYNQSLLFAARNAHVKKLGDEFIARQQNGFDVEWLGQKEIMKQFGFAAPAAILSHDGAYTDAYMLTHGIFQHGIKKGLKVYDRTVIKKTSYGKNGITVHTANGFKIQAKKIVYATGYEVTEMLEKNVVNLQSTYAIASQNIPQNEWLYKDVMLWDTDDPYLYIRRTADNRIIVGGRDEDFFSATKRDKLLKSKAKKLEADFHKIFPHIPFETEFSWTGTFGITKDGLPFIGSYKKFPHTLFALGFGGNGIVFSLIAAQLLTDHLKGKKNNDAAIFSFDRV